MRPLSSRTIAAFCRPWQERIVEHDMRRAALLDVSARRHLAPRKRVQTLAASIQPLGVQTFIDCIGATNSERRRKAVVIRAPAQRTRSMTRCEREGFIVKKQGRPAAGHPFWRDPTFVIEHACDPVLARPRSYDVMPAMNATAVSKPVPTQRRRDDLTVRRDAIAFRHFQPIRRTASHA